MARLELTEEEADLLCDLLHIERESWEAELERILEEESFTSWEDLLRNVSTSQAAVVLLRRITRQLGGEL